MKIRNQDYGQVTVIEMQGEFEKEFTPMLENTVNQLIARQQNGVVLDMNGVTFIDSAGLEELLKARDYCNQNNCQLRLAGLDETCREILTITRLQEEFDYYDELAQAVKSFA